MRFVRRLMVSSRVFVIRGVIARMPNWFARVHTHDATRWQQHAAIVAARARRKTKKWFCHIFHTSWTFKRIIILL